MTTIVGTRFREKLLQGQETDDGDWTEHLRIAHEEVSSMTPPVFSHRTLAGQNSYQILAEAVTSTAPLHVLDLACGDGFLLQSVLPRLHAASQVTGVDMVATDIDRARKNYPDSRVGFLCERAQELSLPSASVDVVLCHMALMLMRPIDPVVAQLTRVLKPGGRLAAVIGGDRTPDALSGKVARLMVAFLKRHFPNLGELRLGDARVDSVSGLRSLFSTGFANDLRVHDFTIEVKGDREAIWAFYKDMYLVGLAPPELKPALRAEIEGLLAPSFDAQGRIVLEYPMRKFEITRA